ncbi:MAG TPA: hypothetical protein VGM80_14395 [Gaiellaceae bacterium]
MFTVVNHLRVAEPIPVSAFEAFGASFGRDEEAMREHIVPLLSGSHIERSVGEVIDSPGG